LLWDVGYDSTLRANLLGGVALTCYADDTLVLAAGREVGRTIRLAEAGVASVVTSMRGLGLDVAPGKTESMWFHNGPGGWGPPESWLRVPESSVRVGGTMRSISASTWTAAGASKNTSTDWSPEWRWRRPLWATSYQISGDLASGFAASTTGSCGV
ncbi:hypothetical protein WH47_05563, partial [Habropoda laboriosa]